MVQGTSTMDEAPSAPAEFTFGYDEPSQLDGTGLMAVYECYRDDMYAEITVSWDGESETARIALVDFPADVMQEASDKTMSEESVDKWEQSVEDPRFDLDVAVEDVESELEEVAAAWVSAIDNRS